MAKKTTTVCTYPACSTCTSSSLKSLGANPIFHLSLSSKELFHSNFLVWLADYQTALFNEILEHCFGCTTFKYKSTDYVALREYKNFDFCICERDAALVDGIGCIVFVLENKCKSIPYKAQLDEYKEKVEKHNDGWGKGKKAARRKSAGFTSPVECHFVLLHLVENFAGKTAIKKEWTCVTYKSYADALKNYSPRCCTSTGYSLEKLLIENYADFIGNLRDCINTPILTSLPTENWTIINAPDCFKKLRIGDIWEKLIANLVVLKLKSELETKLKTKLLSIVLNKGAKDLFVGTKKVPPHSVGTISLLAGFSRGTAIVDVKYKKSKDLIYGIQIQNGQYRQYVESASKKSSLSTDLNNRLNGKLVRSLKFSGPCKFGDTFLYKYVEIPNGTTVKEVLKEIIDDIKTFP